MSFRNTHTPTLSEIPATRRGALREQHGIDLGFRFEPQNL